MQGEYFYREEDGTVVYAGGADSPGHADTFSSAQSGLYLQGIYQFMPRWRAGLRGDWLDSGKVSFASNNASLPRSGFDPSRYSVMLDYSPSEFSRFRVQFSRDESRENAGDNQLFLQFITSIGAHGAHRF